MATLPQLLLLLGGVAGNPLGSRKSSGCEVPIPIVSKNHPKEEYHSPTPWRWHERGGGGFDGDLSEAVSPTDTDPTNNDSQEETDEQQKAAVHVDVDDDDEQHAPKSTTHATTLPHPMTKYEERAILGRAVLTTPHRRMPAIRIAPGPRPSFMSPQNPGPIMTASPMFVTKFSLSESLGCALRDLRVIDQFSSGRYAGPAFLARRNCVIVNVGHVRAIVMRDQVLIFLPELTSSKGSRGGDGKRGDGNSGATSKSAAFQSITHTIEALVEALVTHLNSIYHSSHHLFFDEEGRGTLLAPKQTTHMGQHWGAGWYGATSSAVRSNPVPEMETNVKNRLHRRGRGRKGHNEGGNTHKYITSDSSSPMQEQHQQQQQYSPAATAPPFELVVIEALLGHVCSYESSKVAHLISSSRDVLRAITSNFYPNSDVKKEKGIKKDAFLQKQAKLGELLPLKNKVDELEAKCSEVASAIAEVLKDDEDMANMRLSEISHDGCVPDGDPMNLHVEVELLFEDYLLQMDEVLNSLRTVQRSVQNTEEVVEIELDLLRNRIMSYEMLLELSGLVVGVAAAVTGAFGMNLVNHVEEHQRMFGNVCIALVLFMISLGYGILKKLSLDNII